ncbi:MAG: hypothetical protein ACOZF0_11520 [Thermodesulfobacteriota bacterium]
MYQWILLLLLVSASFSPPTAWARSSRNTTGPQKQFGIGVVAGVPTGITVKFNIDQAISIDGGAGWSTSSDDQLHVYGTGLYHLYHLIRVPKGRLPVYFGAGLRFLSRDKKDDKFGVRIPAGVEYQFADLPLGAFAEIAPVLNLTPDTDFDLEGGIGIRFFF